MEEEHILTANDLESEETPKKGSSGVNKALMGIIVVLLLVMAGGGAYFLGTQKGEDEKTDVVPTQGLIKTETLGEEVEDATAEAQLTATPSGTITPSVTPSVTPTTTPKVLLNPTLKISTEFKLLPTSTPTPIPTLKIQVNPQFQILP